MKQVTMQDIFKALTHELGYYEGKSIAEWYCSCYGVTMVDIAPASVAHEVLGI